MRPPLPWRAVRAATAIRPWRMVAARGLGVGQAGQGAGRAQQVVGHRPLLHRVDVHEREHFPAGQQRRPAAQPREEPPARFLQLADVSPAIGAKVRAQRGRRPDPPNRASIARCRSTSMSSMLSAPAAMPTTRHPIFRCAFTPQSPAGRTCSTTSSGSPARPTSAITGTSPACDTRCGSSNSALVLASACNNCAYRVSSRTGNWKLRQLPFSRLRGHLSPVRRP